jgi:hypothetical protein
MSHFQGGMETKYEGSKAEEECLEKADTEDGGCKKDKVGSSMHR